MQKNSFSKKIGMDMTRIFTEQSDVAFLKLSKFINNVNYKKNHNYNYHFVGFLITGYYQKLQLITIEHVFQVAQGTLCRELG